MSSFSIALPIARDSADGFRMIKDFKSLIKQNLKMLVLTNPGERVMIPGFGIGIKTMLFENFGTETYSNIDNKIREQVKIYMPNIQIISISFDESMIDANQLGIQIMFSIPKIGLTEILKVVVWHKGEITCLINKIK